MISGRLVLSALLAAAIIFAGADPRVGPLQLKISASPSIP